MNIDMNADKLFTVMKSAGFNEDVAKVYCYLLGQDYASLGNICTATNLIEPNVRKAIEYLLELRLIAFDIIKNKYILYALDPEIVWDAYGDDITWRFANTLDDFDLKRAADDLPVNNRELLSYVSQSMFLIKEIASRLYQSYSSVTNHKWRDAINKDHMATLLSESIQQAKHLIRGVSSSPRLPQVALIWQSIVSRMEKGVKYHRIADLTELTEHGLYIVRRDMEQMGIRLMVLDTTEIDQKFYLVDKSLVVVYHKIGVKGDQTIGRVTTFKPIVDRYKKRFDAYSQNALPGFFVLSVLQVRAEQLLKKMTMLGFNEMEIVWFKCLVNWGMFCKLEDPYMKDLDGLEERALKENLIKIGTTNQPIPNYGLNAKRIREVWAMWNSTAEKYENEQLLQEFIAQRL